MSRSIACIDYRDGKVFIAKRQNKGDMGGRWEFPGGKLEEGEDFNAAIKREMKEEFNVGVEIGEHITHTSFLHKNKECFLDAFFVHFEHDGMTKKFDLTEHTEYKWIEIEKIPQLNFVDSDLKIYPMVLQAINKNENYK